MPRKRIYKLNEVAFGDVTEESAYWTGFLMADGTMRKGRGRMAELILCVGSIDIDHLNKLRAFLKTDYPVTRNEKTGIVTISINSDRIAQDLARFGVLPLKRDRGPVIGLENNRHFWRGVVDGDGWVGTVTMKGKYKYFALHAAGPIQLMDQFSAFVREHAPACSARVLSFSNTDLLFRVCLFGKHACRIIKLLYADSGVFLARKQAVALKVLTSNPA